MKNMGVELQKQATRQSGSTQDKNSMFYPKSGLPCVEVSGEAATPCSFSYPSCH
jgi:hypothetical protein